MLYNLPLILEGGGMRGLYTCGVLDFFMDNSIYFKDIYGVSAGACHGCSYVSKQRGRALATSVKYVGDKNYCSIYSLIKTGDLFNVKMLYDEIPNHLEPFDFDTWNKSESRLYSVVCNCRTGKAEYRLLGDMKKDIIWVRASASLPLVSRMVVIDGEKYLDGGIADSIPVKKALESGYDRAVIVLTQPKGYRKSHSSAMPLIRMKYRKYPELVKAMENRHIVYNETAEFIEKMEDEGRAFVLRPEKSPDFARIEKDPKKLNALYEEGLKDAEKSFQALEKFLAK